MNLRKNHVKVEEYIGGFHLFEGSLDGVSNTVGELRERADSLALVDAEIVCHSYGEAEYELVGWRPMTEEELAKAEKDRIRKRKANAAAKAKKEQVERETLEKLAKKYGKELK